ncbi:MAG: hypothetical protein ABW250_14245 [Pyrinomonadaceae bacterium]
MQRHALLIMRHIPTKGLLALAALASLAGLAVAAGAWGTPAALEMPSVSPSAAESRLSGAQGGTDAGLPVVRVTIRPTGFDPAEVTLPRGRFMLAVDNRTGLNQLTFRFDREGGGRLHEVRMTREQLAWRKVVDPPPGSYVLTEINHPGWVCRITVAD